MEDSTDRGAWQTTVHGVVESDTTDGLTLSLNFSTSHYVLLWWKRPGHSLGSLIRTLIPFLRAPSAWPNHPKSSPPNTNTLGVRFQHFGGTWMLVYGSWFSSQYHAVLPLINGSTFGLKQAPFVSPLSLHCELRAFSDSFWNKGISKCLPAWAANEERHQVALPKHTPVWMGVGTADSHGRDRSAPPSRWRSHPLSIHEATRLS